MYDFDYRLEQLDEIDERSLKIKKTGESDDLLVVTCRARSAVPDALSAIERVWLDELRYSYIEAHDSTVLPDGTGRFRFVTQMDRGSMYVTGTIQVVPAVT